MDDLAGEHLLSHRAKVTLMDHSDEFTRTDNLAVGDVSYAGSEFDREEMVRAEGEEFVASHDNKVGEVFVEDGPLGIWRAEDLLKYLGCSLWCGGEVVILKIDLEPLEDESHTFFDE